MKIEDNFLDQNLFDEIQTLMMGEDFAWYYSDIIDFEDDEIDKFMFSCLFYIDKLQVLLFPQLAPTSNIIEQLTPILEILNPLSIFRIKANLLTRTPNIIKNEFHVDMGGIPEEKLKQFTTSIFYVNTNNGWTEFEDGTKVESVANRMVTFPANVKHRGTSCTDEKIRVVINFNYFK